MKRYSILKRVLVVACATSLCFSNIAPVYAADRELLGLDVSKWNKEVDWELVKEQGVEFVMLKTGNGQKSENNSALDIDPYFEVNYDGATAAGIPVGVYHMIAGRTVEAARKEAEHCLEILDGRELAYPVVYDIESSNADYNSNVFSTGKDNITDMAIAFCEVIEEAGYTPMIYAKAHDLSNYFDYDKIQPYKIWVAHYGVDVPDYDNPYHIWQYTHEGSIDGANNDQGFCDLNTGYEMVTLNLDSISLGTKETFTMKADVFTPAASDEVIWDSSNKEVATISKSGKITATAAGKTTISATTATGLSETCEVTVKAAPKTIQFVSGSKKLTSKTMKKGSTYSLKTKLTDKTASYHLTFKSSNTKVATVSKTGKITAKKAGTSTITVQTFNGKKATIKITVRG